MNRRVVTIIAALVVGLGVIAGVSWATAEPPPPPYYCREKARVDAALREFAAAGPDSKEFWGVALELDALARGPAKIIEGPARAAGKHWLDAVTAARNPVRKPGSWEIDRAATNQKIAAATSAMQNSLSQIQGYCDSKA